MTTDSGHDLEDGYRLLYGSPDVAALVHSGQESVLQASNQGMPAIHLAGSNVAEAYADVIARFLGEQRPLRFTTVEKVGLFQRIFGGK